MSGPDHEKFAQWDGAYVLGALTSADRHAYEQHLEECARCRDAVAELVPMPGLLAQIRPERTTRQTAEAAGGGTNLGGAEPVAPARADGTPGPAGSPADRTGTFDTTPLPLERTRPRRTRRRRVLAGAVAAVAVAVLAIVLPLGLGDRAADEREADVVAVAPSPPDGGPAPMRVDVELAPASWGTRLTLSCDYPSASPAAGGGPAYGDADSPPWYALVVTAEDGTRSQVSSWQGVPGEVVTLEAATAIDLAAITAVSVVDPTGTTVLTAEIDGP